MNFIIENFKKPKTILIVLGLTAMIVFSVMLVGYGSYLRTTISTSSCTDSDGGKDYYKKGTVTLSDGTKLTDYCMTGGYAKHVMEYWCTSDGHGMGNFECPNSCQNGACAQGTTPPPPTCTDSDGGINVMKKGTTKDNSHSYTDYCIGNSIVEYFCQNGVAKRASTSPSGYSCSRYGQNMICQNGACAQGTTPPPPTCTDSDGGINVMKKGTTKDNSHSYTDYCIGNSIVEYFCQNGVAKRASTSPSGYSCSRYGQNMICQNGACAQGEPEPKCEADGKCKYPGCPNGDTDCSCTEQKGNICQTNETCSGTSLSHSGTGTCCSIACTPAAIYSISGQIISNDSNYSVVGIEVSLTGDIGLERIRQTVDANGSYSFINLTNGSYAITPSDDTWTFSPTSQNATISSSNISGINFTAIKKECNLGETKNHTCPDGTEVNWCTCDNYKWACIDSPENNCPALCEEDGKCKTSGCPTGDPDCACSEYEPSGFICQENETCLGTSLTHSGSGLCCSIACESGVADFQTADLNCNGSVNLTDYSILMNFWHKDPSGFDSCQSPDINQDGAVNLTDSSILVSQWTEKTL